MKITLTGEDFNRIMRVCTPAMSREDSREALRHIEIKCDGKGHGVATALNGFTLAQTCFACQGKRGKMLIGAYKNVSNDCMVEIELQDGNISISDGVETITRKAFEGAYVDHETIVKGAQAKEHSITIALDRNRLRRALDSYRTSASTVVFEIYGPEDAIIMRGADAAGLLLPMRMHTVLNNARFGHEEE